MGAGAELAVLWSPRRVRRRWDGETGSMSEKTWSQGDSGAVKMESRDWGLSAGSEVTEEAEPVDVVEVERAEEVRRKERAARRRGRDR